ncbi:hypothetical protein ASF56_18450 [Methylobacterium sp. Leaf122]|uniref:Uncharacterized protein n=1 Tax=Methylorubrum extorquens TaxID=408 RepID=A0A1S1P7F1_METEX|nr:hypothetical protein ASF33_05420 [Methylobacterium sp. Leaf92]KQQ17388.1 hypothetical protein ASF59_00135 [Methylobacterium sp. Leaf121]KQQ21529.1 hypothetical protein ASF56_18450 [Methylobacterium sp. Leaf122]OHV15824.1 hypothetical protein BK022_16310 [Methylorubrum extorquens]
MEPASAKITATEPSFCRHRRAKGCLHRIVRVDPPFTSRATIVTVDLLLAASLSEGIILPR